MRNRIMQPQTEKPTVGVVDLYLLDRLPHAADPEHILQHRQLEQDNRVKAGASVILAVAILYQVIDEAPVNGFFQLSYEVIFRNKFLQACELNLSPGSFLRCVSSFLSPPVSLF